MTGPSDGLASMIPTILRNESLTQFEVGIEDVKATEAEGEDDEDNAGVALTITMVEGGLEAESASVFPHRALETQKQWMRRGMKKPQDLSFCRMAAAVGRINNSFPLF